MRFRTTRFLSVAVVMAGTSLVLTANANAVPGPDTNPEVIAAVGSDTTFTVDDAIFKAANSAAGNTDPDNDVNVPPVLVAGASFPVPGDVFDPGRTYANPGNLPRRFQRWQDHAR
jgi:phosphate transport system substrate-binding protein